MQGAGGSETDYRDGLAALQQARDPGRALTLLEKAAQAGHADARNVLGSMLANGIGVPADAARARAEFTQAAAAGSVAAPYNLSNLLFNAVGGPANRDAAMEYLLEAGRRGHPPALRAIALLAENGGEGAGVACLRFAASKGDMVAAYLLGNRLLAGGAPAIFDDGMAWLALAAQAGVNQAQRRFQEWRVSGRPLPAAPPSIDAGRMELPASLIGRLQFELPSPRALSPRLLNDSPRVAVVDELLDSELTDYLIIRAEPQLAASETVHPDSGNRIQNTLRTSRSMNFFPGALDVPLGVILERIACVSGLSLEYAEPLAVLHYAPGQEYRPHYDYFTAEALSTQGELGRAGQRVATVLTYLSDVEAGGETEFPELGLKVAAKRGRSFVFANCDEHGRPDPRSLHAGRPVAAGEKWVATLWFRERGEGPLVQEEMENAT